MRLRIILFSVIALCAPLLHADEWMPVTPEDLKYSEAGAPAVILYQREDTDDTHSSSHNYVRIKILSEEGKKYATVEIPYDRGFMRIMEIHGRTISPDGTITPFDGKVYEKTVVKGHGVKILEKAFTLPSAQIGSIVEYKYGMYWDDRKLVGARWIVQDELKKVHAHYSFKAYQGDVVGSHGNIGSGIYWSNFLPPGPKPVNSMSGITELDLTNVPAFQEEEFMPPADQMKYRVLFYYGGGVDLTNVEHFWKDEAKYWNKEVNKFLSSGSAVTALVNEAGVAPNDTPEVKAKKLYDRVQKLENLTYSRERTAAEDKRADYKPPKSAEDVAKFGAGYRKDITRLYVAMAHEAGLKAYGMKVSTRDEFFFDKNTPNANQLNSEIAIVELGGKEVFLDPGTRFCPFGLLEWKRTGVMGIRQMPSGDATFAQTPLVDPNKALTIRAARLTLKMDGSAEGNMAIAFRDIEALVHRLQYLDMDAAGRKKDLEDEVRSLLPGGSDATLTELQNPETADLPLVANFKVTIPQLGSSAGRRMLLPSSVLEINRKQVLTHNERKLPIYFSYPYRELDKVTIVIPDGIQVDAVPEKKQVDTDFAIFRRQAVNSGSELKMDRDFAVLGLGAQAKSYPELKSFFETVKASDDEQVMLKQAATVSAQKDN